MKFGATVRRFFGAMLLLATLAGATHHHADLKPHADCPLCILQNNLTGGDLPASPSLPCLAPSFLPEFPAFTRYEDGRTPLLPSVRAPPKLS